MSLPQSLTTPTRFSKYLAILVFVTLPFIGFLLGVRYQEVFMQSEKMQEESNLLIERTPTPTPLAIPTVDPSVTANWKTYSGKYFSFKYPSTWIEQAGPKDGEEDIGFRISPNAVFGASYYINESYEQGIRDFEDRKSSKLKIDAREATRFELTDAPSVLPSGYSIISFVVKGLGNTSYSIGFNGDRKDIEDQLITQILSTFQFSN
ncbi:MAG: hypothetical protein HYT07_00775 [Candidatus Levybacteria bacterium]|nr:hypothetical protein [Candidatus Levybacteria bacterium]